MLSTKKDKLIAFFKENWQNFVAGFLIVVAVLSTISLILNYRPAPKVEDEFIEQDTIYFATEGFTTLNPYATKNENTYYLAKLIYNGLFEFDENLEPIPVLCENYTISSNGKKMTIKLKEGVLFSNGQELTSADIRFSIRAILAAKDKSPYYSFAKKIKKTYLDSTYEITLEFASKNDCAIANLTFPIVYSKTYSNTGSFIGHTKNYKGVGTGDYVVATYEPTKKLVIKPSARNTNGSSKTTVVFNIIRNMENAQNLMKINEVTCYIEANSKGLSKAKNNNYKIYDIPSNSTDLLIFNDTLNVKSSELRKALLTSINFGKILEDAYMGTGTSGFSPYFPNYLGITVEDPLSYNREAARNAIVELGYVDKNNDGFFQDEDGKRLSVVLLTDSSNAMRVSCARKIEKYFNEIGVGCTLVLKTGSKLDSDIENKKFDIYLAGITFGPDCNLKFLFDGTNAWGYKHDELAAITLEMQKVHYLEDYKTYYTKLLEVLSQDPVCYAICHKRVNLVGQEYFSAEKLPNYFNIYKNVETFTWKILKPEEKPETEDPSGQEDADKTA